MLEFGPRSQCRVEVLLIPLLILHEIGHIVGCFVERLKRQHPVVGDTRLPVYLAHAQLHPVQVDCVLVPSLWLVQLLNKDFLGSRDSHSRHDIESLGSVTHGYQILIVDHFLEHFAIGGVALWHEIDFAMT